ncbi:3,7-dimethylxanthine N-methyltransferase CkTbS-like [Telopea speciosissima]|uniref:3,7-dimethylxanthine N-methyltransferase CkTbS-like n=1 Tax=Telopea speciosissima TaxID=54955 RepID=UPI001CC760C5|nr:3,7-dimethylxanthine N-methyltransferase CkTbS-like [Telopea speciosissima]
MRKGASVWFDTDVRRGSTEEHKSGYQCTYGWQKQEEGSFVHWVPPGLTSEVGIPINKGKIYISNTSPPTFSKAYLEQFEQDFTLFIKLRSKELIPNARMVLILHGRQGGDPSLATCDYWELLSEALIAMVAEGLIEEEKLDSFNVPYYTASCEEIQERSVISIAKPILEKAIEDLVNEGLPSNVLTIADLGCAFGPNTFTVITTIKRKVEKRCNELGVKQPELQVFLNDLPGNDFNSTFKFFFENYQQLEGERIGEDGKKCFIAGAPGSFYERLFPKNTLHLVHSCYSAHWLSRVPPGLTSEVGIPINKGKIYISNTSPPTVGKAYLEQFQEDFTSFVKLRSKELIPNARMVLILHGRQGGDPSSATCDYWELLSEALIAMVSEGLIEEEKLDSFNVPYYTASCEEIQEVIDKEGSFDTKQLVTFALDIGDKEETNM